ncbi:MAG: cupredoxin domain-containing protein [Acidimicrobiia bacterium]|nr:cupredoxin domain-containing protein [Acidimicrobiia bacterium]
MSSSSHRRFGAVVAMSALLLAGCGGGGGGGAGSAEAEAEADENAPAESSDTGDVTIVNFGYEEAEFTTSAGTEVAWVNEGSAPHTVTGDDFDSGVIRKGFRWTHTFEEPGTYEYWCTNHEGMMLGTVVVE